MQAVISALYVVSEHNQNKEQNICLVAQFVFLYYGVFTCYCRKDIIQYGLVILKENCQEKFTCQAKNKTRYKSSYE